MKMRILNTCLVMLVFLLGMACTTAEARTIYVDDDGLADYDNIQAAIDAAVDGDEVVVAEGTYESVSIDGKSITLRSTDPTNPDVVAATIIDGRQSGSVVTFNSSENSSCVLSGFMVTNGYADRGGGVYCRGSSPTISNCTFSGNIAEWVGGGMNTFCSNPTLTNCMFIRNAAYYGGGMGVSGGNPTLVNCTFTENSAAHNGGGMYVSSDNATLTNCTFIRNSAGKMGGGMDNAEDYNVILTNCTFYGNSADMGGGITALDCVSDLTLANCILWGNSDSDGTDESAQITGRALNIRYSCIQGWTGGLGGSGNIDADPRFADAPNADYHLLPDSPCIDTGDPNYVPEPGETDLDGKPRIVGGTVDMGVYEFWCPRILYVDAAGANDGSSWADAYNYLQDALTAAWPGDEIRVAQGTYKPDQGVTVTPGDREATFQLKNGVTLKGGYASFGEPDPNARDIELYETILSGDLGGNDVEGLEPSELLNHPSRGENSYHIFYHPKGLNLDSAAILDGFTITGGNANTRYGNSGGMYNYKSSPTITNCTFSNNSAASSGGGVANHFSSPMLSNCTFICNWSLYNGGGMFNDSSSPTLVRCAFIGNSVEYKGGGMANGGDEDECYPILTNCIFSGNCTEKDGGGIYNWWGDLTLINCTFTGNSAEGYGGGVDNYDNGRSTIINCTFAMNSAANGNALSCKSRSFSTFEPYACLTNCILWDGDSEIWDPESRVTVTYSDVHSGWPGEGNIDADPRFISPGYWDDNTTPEDVNDDFWVDGDYHLLPSSPCINAGDPNYMAEPNETDLDGRPRIIGGRIDMGAFEYSPPIPAEVRIVPRTINLTSMGKWITCYIWLGEDYNVIDIDPNSIVLEDKIQAESLKVDEQEQVAIAKFNRSDVQDILETGDIELTITGQLTDGDVFEGTDVIRVIDKAGKK